MPCNFAPIIVDRIGWSVQTVVVAGWIALQISHSIHVSKKPIQLVDSICRDSVDTQYIMQKLKISETAKHHKSTKPVSCQMAKISSCMLQA